MKVFFSVKGFILFVLLALLASCGEFTPPPVNSENGLLYVDLEEALASGWESEILVFGPVRSGQSCHGGECYYDHRELEILSIESSNEEILEVLGSREERFLGVPGTWVKLKAHEEGEARISLTFQVDGLNPADLEEEQENESAQGGEAEEDFFVDSFTVEVRTVDRVRIQRFLDHVDTGGIYGSCPATGSGVYLTESPGSFDVLLNVELLDYQGQRLRGQGEPPFEVHPEESIEIIEFLERDHTYRIRARQMGPLEIKPKIGEGSVTLVYRSLGFVEGFQTHAYLINDQGGRLERVTRFRTQRLYEVEVIPELEAPLCGGRLQYRVDSMTPALCEPVATVEARGTTVFYSHFAGDCVLRVTLVGGEGLQEELVFPVDAGF